MSYIPHAGEMIRIIKVNENKPDLQQFLDKNVIVSDTRDIIPGYLISVYINHILIRKWIDIADFECKFVCDH